MLRLLASFLLVIPFAAEASGPVAPAGWNGSNEATLPGGQPCCQAADLNGSGLVGGAFVLVSDSKNEFAVFALTYSSSLKARWWLLERHPISELPRYSASIAVPSPGPNAGIKVCRINVRCSVYFLTAGNASAFKKVKAS
jgi:hypothetical protein